MTIHVRVLQALALLYPPDMATHPLLRLLGYIRPHRRYALLTVGFGILSFALSFVYPWIIGAAVVRSSDPRRRD